MPMNNDNSVEKYVISLMHLTQWIPVGYIELPTIQVAYAIYVYTSLLSIYRFVTIMT